MSRSLTPYEQFGTIQKWLSDNGPRSYPGDRCGCLPTPRELDAEGRESIEKLVEKLEEDDDVVNVYHNMKEADESSGRSQRMGRPPCGSDGFFTLNQTTA